METFEAARPRQDHVLFQLSRSHLVEAGPVHGDVDAWERLKRAFAAVGMGCLVPPEETSLRLSAAGVRIPPATSLSSPASAGERTGNPEGRTKE